MKIQSLDLYGVVLDATSDVYSVKFTRSDSGGSEQLTTTAVYKSAGLYETKITPTIAGKYTVTVHMSNSYTTSYPSVSTEISGSPFTVTVDSDPAKSKIKTFSTAHLAGAVYTMTIESRDA